MSTLVQINTLSARYKRARLARYFSHSIKVILATVALSSLVLAILFLVSGNQLGWLLLAAPLVIFMFFEWWWADLSKNQPDFNQQSPTDLLDSKVLVHFVKTDNDFTDIIQAISNHDGQRFLSYRFNLNTELLQKAQLPADNSIYWDNVLNLFSQYHDEEGVDSAHLSLPLVLSAENKKDLLLASTYKEDDLKSGLEWYLYLKRSIKTINQRKNSGGIARDWAAGYTPLLNQFSKNLSQEVQYGFKLSRGLEIHQDVVGQMLSIFVNNGRANCALVGEEGVGKTTCVRTFAEQLLFGEHAKKINYNQIYQVDMASITSSVPANQLEAVITRLFVEAYKAKNIILYFSNSLQLFEPPNSEMDLTNTVLPIIEAGNVRTIFTFNPREWQHLERNKPKLVSLLNYQVVQEPKKEDTLQVLENKAIFVEQQNNCLFTYNSLTEIFKLAERYGPDIAMPAKAVAVMEAAGRNGVNNIITKEVVQKSVEATTGIKVGIADQQERDALVGLEEKLKQRVVGQEKAIEAVCSALKRSRAGVASAKKPIGTFLFLGPTGVGKTELSKALAEAYFGGESNLVRSDMNEFITTDSVHRLLSSGNISAPSFLDNIRKQPFTVVLLDEIEKANDDIKNVLLQMLDEGTLIDSQDHTVSFKDAIIIATSNAGANYIREAIVQGESIEKLSKEMTERLISEGVFKPEFLNRFDAIVVFSPLTVEQLRQVVSIMIENVNQQLASQQLKVVLTSKAIDWLVLNGNDSLLGARPLRRLIQSSVENSVSDKILAGQAVPGEDIVLDQADLETHMSSK